MSLLNKVLRDLDARRASDLERQQVPLNVKPLPPAAAHSFALPKRLLVIGALLLVALIAVVVFQKTRTSEMLAPVPEAVPATAPIEPPSATPIETPAISATHELKLDMSSLSLKVPDTETGVASHRAAVVTESKTTDRKKTEPPPQKTTQTVEKAGETESKATGKVIVSPQPGAHDETGYRRALGMIEHGQKAEAETLLRQILDADPAYHTARQSLFKLLAANGQQDDAAALLADGLRLNPANTQWAMNLARLQVERGDNAGAWETLKRTLPSATSQADYRAFCGTVLQRLNQPAEAASHYQAALRINPTEGRWWVGYALSLEADNKSAESREAFSRAQATGNLPPDLAAFVEGKLRK